MGTTDLKLDEPGTLRPPGPIGRLLRLGFGVLCLSQVNGLLTVAGNLFAANGGIRSFVWTGIVLGLFLVSYIINIGYSRAWKKYPALVSAAVLACIAGVGYLSSGTIETQFFARSLWIWELYLFSHLGLAFVIAAVIGTPGCEMRAFHDLYSRLSGIATMEHACPVGPLSAIDRWEAGRS